MILFADSEGPDQTARMRRLIWAFAIRICRRHVPHGAVQIIIIITGLLMITNDNNITIIIIIIINNNNNNN